jgi:peptide-methionine (S)-S-oxide reductase
MPRILLTLICLLVAGSLLSQTVLAGRDDTDTTRTAVFAGGCFWCVEEAFDQVDGVTETISGYTGGDLENPTYRRHDGHQEAVLVRYDPEKVDYKSLLDHFWRNVDPFDPHGQFCDKGNSYKAVIFFGDEAERVLAEASKQAVAQRFGQEVATEIRPLKTFHRAEYYHQDFYLRNAVKYKYYKNACGRAQRLEEIWGVSKPS